MDDYQKSLEQCTTVGTALSIHNKLNAVRVSTEDEKLRKLISDVFAQP